MPYLFSTLDVILMALVIILLALIDARSESRNWVNRDDDLPR